MNLMTMGHLVATRRKWTNPYITDGLVAMWDGEWNSSGGVHDEDATVWKNLILGGRDWIITEHGSWLPKGLKLDGNGIVGQTEDASKMSYEYIEVCARCNTLRPNGGFNFLLTLFKSAYQDQGCVINCVAAFRTTPSHIQTGGSKGSLMVDSDDIFTSVFTVGSRRVYFNEGYLRLNGSAANNAGGSSTTLFSGNYIGHSSICADAELYCIRMYDRIPTVEESSANYAVDKERFDL